MVETCAACVGPCSHGGLSLMLAAPLMGEAYVAAASRWPIGERGGGGSGVSTLAGNLLKGG